VLTSKAIKPQNGDYDLMDVGKEEAYDLKDSMAKIVYARMFNWIIEKVNKAISGNSKSKQKQNFIGLLDIFGFEIFEHNCFEQLCINYANEKLQQHFNNYMFQNEQHEYLREGLVIDHIKFKDNKKCIDLIEKNSSTSPSIFSLLDDFSIMNKNKVSKDPKKIEDELIEKFESNLIHNEHFESIGGFGSKQRGFVVHHFAGKVEYKTKNFLEKNKDSVSPLIESLFAQGEHVILNSVFTDYIGKGIESEESKQIRGHSLAFQFKDQLNDLMKILNVSSPRYIRCIKPNGVMKPNLLDSDDVRRQLVCAGVLEAIRIRKIGYPIRKLVKDFIRRYKPILSFHENSKMKSVDLVSY
jgi:myosin heavy subunit